MARRLPRLPPPPGVPLLTKESRRDRHVWVPIGGDYFEALDMAFSDIDFSKAEDFDRTRWTRDGTNPWWSIGTVVE